MEGGARNNQENREWGHMWKWELQRGSFSWAPRKELHWSWGNSLKLPPGKLQTTGMLNQRIWKNTVDGPQGTHSSPMSFMAAAPAIRRANNSLQSIDSAATAMGILLKKKSLFVSSNPTLSRRRRQTASKVNRGSWLHRLQYTIPDPARSSLLPKSLKVWGRSFSTQLAFNSPDAQSQGSAAKLLKPLPGARVVSCVWNVSVLCLTPSSPSHCPFNQRSWYLVTFHKGKKSSFIIEIRDLETPMASTTALLYTMENKPASNIGKALGTWVTRTWVLQQVQVPSPRCISAKLLRRQRDP